MLDWIRDIRAQIRAEWFMSVDAVMCTLVSETGDTLTLPAPQDLHSPGPGIARNVRVWAQFNGHQSNAM